MDHENNVMYGVLASVVLVGVIGLYVASITPSPIYVQNIRTINPTTYQVIQNTPTQSILSKVNPFRIFGQGLIGMSSTRNGTGTVTLSTTVDLRMPKSTITCTASVNQDSDGVSLYTCGDQAAINGSIVCEGGNKSTFTEGDCINGTANTGQLNGSFQVENHGAYGPLDLTVLNITIGGLTATSVFLNVTLYNYTHNQSGLNASSSVIFSAGCKGGNWSLEGSKMWNNSLGTSCNRCYLTGQAGPCFLGLSGNSGGGTDNINVCRNFSTSGVGVCQCYGIHVTNASDIHKLKSGQQLAFTVRSTINATQGTAC